MVYTSWQIREKNNPYKVEEIAQSLRISPLTAELLIYRGIKTVEEARKFINPSLFSLNSPFSLPDMKKAKERIEKAINDNEKILLYGDYDVDGITGVALLYYFFQSKGIKPEVYIPHRREEGYGFHREVVENFSHKGVSLIITIDCGTEGEEAAWECKRRGIDLIICDHHRKKGDLPPSFALINPHIYKESKGKELAGCGIAFKLVQSLDEKEAFKHLDLVSVGTIADIVPVIGDNRIFAKVGIPLISRTDKKGLKALLNSCGIKKRSLTSWDISFLIAPRLNAGGRIAHAMKSLELLISSNDNVEDIATSLELDNRKRRKEELKIIKEAEVMARKGEKAIVVAGDNWHVGVLGIVASRLVEKYSLPSFVISIPSDKRKAGKGSARGFSGVNIFHLLENSQDLLITYGGHEKAGGFEIFPEKIDEFRERIFHLMKDFPSFEEKILVDKEIPLDILTLSQGKELSLLSPFGEGNEEPLFLTRKVELVTSPKPLGNGHIKFWVKGKNLYFEVLGFGWENKLKDGLNKGDKIDMIYTPRVNNWEGEKTVVLLLKGLKK